MNQTQLCARRDCGEPVDACNPDAPFCSTECDFEDNRLDDRQGYAAWLAAT